jgi:hypothetical protein
VLSVEWEVKIHTLRVCPGDCYAGSGFLTLFTEHEALSTEHCLIQNLRAHYFLILFLSSMIEPTSFHFPLL